MIEQRAKRSSRSSGPRVAWHHLQPKLECAESDVVILLDTCHAASVGNVTSYNDSHQQGRTELIAACAFDQIAPSGPNSFTAAIIAVLKNLAKEDPEYLNTFSVLKLYKLLSATMMRNSGNASHAVDLATKPVFSNPVYLCLTEDDSKPSIPFKRFSKTGSIGPENINDDWRPSETIGWGWGSTL